MIFTVARGGVVNSAAGGGIVDSVANRLVLGSACKIYQCHNSVILSIFSQYVYLQINLF